MCLLLEQLWFPKGDYCLDKASQSILTREGPHDVSFAHLVFGGSLCSAAQGRPWAWRLWVIRPSITLYHSQRAGLELSSHPGKCYPRAVTGVLYPDDGAHTHRQFHQSGWSLIRLFLTWSQLSTGLGGGLNGWYCQALGQVPSQSLSSLIFAD